MYCLKKYKDLKTEIELTKDRMDMLKEERKIYLKLMQNGCPQEVNGQAYSDMPKGSRNDMSLDRIVDEISKIDNMLYIEEERLKVIEKYEKEISSKLDKLQGLHYKVYYLHEIEGKTYREIAIQLNISEQYAKDLGSEAKRMKE